MKLRFFCTILLLVLIFLSPWWLTFAVALALIFYFRRYYEAFFAAFLFDLLYNTSRTHLFFFAGLATVAVSFVLIEWLKKRLSLYEAI